MLAWQEGRDRRVSGREQGVVMKRVLVLEDVAETARWLADRVRGAFGPDVSVSLAHTLAAARRLTGQEEFDLFIVDLGLPDGDGIDFIRDLDPVHTGANVVVMTIYDDDDHVFRALRAGARGYLLKDQTDAGIEQALSGVGADIPALSPGIARRMMDYFARPAAVVTERCDLTQREREVLVLIAGGRSVQEVATQLAISVHTVRGYVKDIYRKLGISTRAEASLRAVRMGLMPQL